MWAMSAVVPKRRRGIMGGAASLTWGGRTSVMSVVMKPGATQLAVTCLPASSRAMDLVMPIMPALEAEELTCPAVPTMPETLAILMMRPHLARIMVRAAARQATNADLRLVLI